MFNWTAFWCAISVFLFLVWICILASIFPFVGTIVNILLWVGLICLFIWIVYGLFEEILSHKR